MVIYFHIWLCYIYCLEKNKTKEQKMYHIKEDKRARASVELICAGLMDCLS